MDAVQRTSQNSRQAHGKRAGKSLIASYDSFFQQLSLLSLLSLSLLLLLLLFILLLLCLLLLLSLLLLALF